VRGQLPDGIFHIPTTARV